MPTPTQTSFETTYRLNVDDLTPQEAQTNSPLQVDQTFLESPTLVSKSLKQRQNEFLDTLGHDTKMRVLDEIVQFHNLGSYANLANNTWSFTDSQTFAAYWNDQIADMGTPTHDIDQGFQNAIGSIYGDSLGQSAKNQEIVEKAEEQETGETKKTSYAMLIPAIALFAIFWLAK